MTISPLLGVLLGLVARHTVALRGQVFCGCGVVATMREHCIRRKGTLPAGSEWRGVARPDIESLLAVPVVGLPPHTGTHTGVFSWSSPIGDARRWGRRLTDRPAMGFQQLLPPGLVCFPIEGIAGAVARREAPARSGRGKGEGKSVGMVIEVRVYRDIAQPIHVFATRIQGEPVAYTKVIGQRLPRLRIGLGIAWLGDAGNDFEPLAPRAAEYADNIGIAHQAGFRGRGIWQVVQIANHAAAMLDQPVGFALALKHPTRCDGFQMCFFERLIGGIVDGSRHILLAQCPDLGDDVGVLPLSNGVEEYLQTDRLGPWRAGLGIGECREPSRLGVEQGCTIAGLGCLHFVGLCAQNVSACLTGKVRRVFGGGLRCLTLSTPQL
jgi:hypothetical protein